MSLSNAILLAAENALRSALQWHIVQTYCVLHDRYRAHQDDACPDCMGQSQDRHQCQCKNQAQQGLDDPLAHVANKNGLQGKDLSCIRVALHRCGFMMQEA